MPHQLDQQRRPQGSMAEEPGLSKTVTQSGRKRPSTVFSPRSQIHADESSMQSRVTGSTGTLHGHTVTAAERDGSNTDPTLTGICCRDLLAYETHMPTATPHSNLAKIQIQRRGVESSTSRRSCREANNRQTQQRLPESSATKHKQTKF